MRYFTLIYVLLVTASQLCFSVRASAQQILERKVNLSVENESLKTVFQQLREQVPVNFVYSSKAGVQQISVTIRAEDQRLSVVLNEILPDHLTFEVVNNAVVIKIVKPGIGSKSDRADGDTPGGIIEGEMIR